ncbi:MAG: GntR family transcriptional regulator [Bryobacteraceae bacterium]|jgi:GntR family transcriptional regulator of vanillate catabolism
MQAGDKKPESQIERVALALREMLLRGDFSPGERLAELNLVPRLNASRTPVRLALERLANEGLLETVPTGGFRIREFTIADVWDAIEIRGVLEGTAARLAAERLTGPADLARLRRYCRDGEAVIAASLDDFVRYLEINDRFHRELWRLSKSPMLQRAIDAAIAFPFAAPGALVFSDAEFREGTAGIVALEHHRAIVEAIENREGTRAEAVAREHSRVAKKNLARALKDSALFRRVPGAPLVKVPADTDLEED